MAEIPEALERIARGAVIHFVEVQTQADQTGCRILVRVQYSNHLSPMVEVASQQRPLSVPVAETADFQASRKDCFSEAQRLHHLIDLVLRHCRYRF